MAACESTNRSRSPDWPAAAAQQAGWGLERILPADATWTAALVLQGGEARRDDTWTFALDGPADGRIVHEMRWRGGAPGDRVEREELTMVGGRVQARTLGPEALPWPDDRRWRWAMSRPRADFEGMAALLGDAAEERYVEALPGADGVVAARLSGGRDGWRATLGYEVRRR